MNDMDKEMKKRREAMKQRLEKLGTDNPVVAEAIKHNKPHKDMEEFGIIDELVMAARKNFEEDGNLKECAISLSEALQKIAKNGGLDKGKSNSDNGKQSNVEVSERY